MARMTTTLLLLLFGCGTSDPMTWKACPGCAAAGGTWSVIADGAEITGDYDVVGPPDPYLCMTIKGMARCSSQQSDSSSPRWNQTIASRLLADELTGSSLPVALWDVDTGGGLDSNDSICSTTLHLTAENLEAGGIRFDCSRATAAFLFRHVR